MPDKRKRDRLSETYQRDPTIKNYVALRRKNPDAWIRSSILDLEEIYTAVSKVDDELRYFDISSELLVSAMDGDGAAISELSLTLMELLIERDAMQKSRRTHLVRRREVISDVLANRLITMMFEGVDKTGRLHLNPDLVVLINNQLSGPVARLYKQRERKLSIDDIRMAAADLGTAGINPSLRAIAEQLGVHATTVLRSLPKADLQRIQAAYRPTKPAAKFCQPWQRAYEIVKRYMPEGTGIDGRAFILTMEIVAANPDLPDPKLLPMVEDALRDSGARVPRRVAPEV